MIGCFIWIHMSNRHSMKAVQRLVLAASSSTLNYASSAKRNQLPTSIVDDEGLCQLILSTPVVKSQSVLKYRSNPDNSLSFDTPSSFAMTVPIIEDDKPGLTCKKTVASKECNTIAKQTPSYTHDNNMCGLLEDCPAACISGSASSKAAVGQREPDQFNYHPYAKVKRGPKSTSTNNNQFAFSAVPDGECSDGYKMVNFTLGNEPQSTLQNLEFVSESTIQGNVSFHEKDNTRKNYVRDLQNDDGYETCGNINHMTLVEHVKDSEDEGAMTGKYQEPTHCMIPRCAMHSDYADIRI
ncbi:hypothetical protein ACJMK2_031690 [Sinanodonta woodiana]|uniref:Uncharacterized protein n=1 Tax=Sinanodonta woodiana TaxID=1069815 RepID=A0ABD3WZJ1_SINWO